MFEDIGVNIEEIRKENPNLKKQNMIDIAYFAPRVAAIDNMPKK